jgi:hypothetical protein
MSRRALVLASLIGTVALTVLGPVVAAPAALASGNQLLVNAGDGHGWVRDSATPILNFDHLAPGTQTQGSLALKNNAAENGTLSLRATNVHNDDNGCVPQEVAAGDTTCGGGGGDLQRWMVFTVARTDSAGHEQVLWHGTMAALKDGVKLGGGVSAHSTSHLQVTAALPYVAGNDTMTDQLGFDLRWSLECAHSTSSATVTGNMWQSAGTHLIKWALMIPVGALGLAGCIRRWWRRGA